MHLSDRLRKVAEFVTEGLRVADVGTDHGYIPIWLVKNGIAPSAVAMDIAKGPLLRAKEHIELYGLSDKIETRLSDGLERLGVNEADSVIIAGMGGALTVHILERAGGILDSVKELILSPHTEVFLVRHFLIDRGYAIIREEMVKDMGKFYTVIKAVHAKAKFIGEEYDKDEYNYVYGKIMLEEKSPVFVEFMEGERDKLKEVQKRLKESKGGGERKAEISHRLQYIESFLASCF